MSAFFAPTRWTDAALKVLNERYLRKDADGNVIETPDQMCWRVARGVAEAEAKYKGKRKYFPDGTELPEGVATTPSLAVAQWTRTFADLMLSGKFLPNSPCLMNAGTGNGLALAACYVLNIPDSLEGIMETAKRQALIQKSGGGTGFSLSDLRPKGAWVGGTAGQSSGPMSFLRILDTVTDAVKQGMKRRGANMGVISCHHPDVMDFIHAKLPKGERVITNADGSESREVIYDITNFNLSVGISDAFMRALANGTYYDLIDPHTDTVVGSLLAQEVWDAMVHCAWETGDPGCLFIERANQSKANPIPEVEQIKATNPCGEQYLFDSDVCNLGSLNLARFVVNHAEAIPMFDWEAFTAAVHLATRFLDNVIDINPYPLPSIDARAKQLRRIGLGVMGWADLLVLLTIPYDSPKAVELGTRIMQEMYDAALLESETLASERGAFPMQNVSRYNDDHPRRNSNLTTVAPTGTISLLANCSSGIEPYFLLAYEHRVKQPDGSWRVLPIISEAFQHVATEHGFWSDDLKAHVLATGSVQGRADVPENWQRILRCANDVAAFDHVRMQAGWQKHNDSSISKSVNLPESTTEAEIADIYRFAYESGCMGITVYRDNCKQFQVLNVAKKEPAAPAPLLPQPESQPESTAILERPMTLSGKTHRVNGPGGSLFVTVNRMPDDGDPFEVFVEGARVGSEAAALMDGIGRLLSLALRLPSPLSRRERMRLLTEQLKGLGGSISTGFGIRKVRSIPDGIAFALTMDAVSDNDIESIATKAELSAPTSFVLTPVSPTATLRHVGDLCPDCGDYSVVRESGCEKCLACGWSRC